MYGQLSLWRLILNIFCLGLVVFFILSFNFGQAIMPVSEIKEETTLLKIPHGSSSANISNILAESGLIRNRFIFRLYTKYKGYDQKLQAGDYEFTPAMTIDEILEKLVRGDTVVNDKKITIPEGLHIEQVASRLEAQNVVDAQVFLEKCADGKYSYWFLENVPDSPYPLEGYLFPDTYYVEEEWKEEEIINMFLRRFEVIFSDTYRKRAEELNMSVHEVVTLASIIEREARLKDERPVISAVFYNRLQRNMLLQSCATVQYALGEIKPVLTTEDTEIDSPYNTYKNMGLPPGPIASPGEDALYAALYPADSEYLYFVLKGDGSGGHYFGRTFQEHEANRRKAKQEREAR